MVICLVRGRRYRFAMAQLISLPLTISCSSKSRLVLPFWYQLTRVVPVKGPLNRCCCCCCCCYTYLHECVILGSSELSIDELLVLQSLVSVLLPLLRYVTADGENSHEVCVLHVLYYQGCYFPETRIPAKARFGWPYGKNGRLGGHIGETGSRNTAATQKINSLTLVSYSLLQTVFC